MTIKFRSLTEHDEINRYVSGTSYSGAINISYAKLVEVLGEGTDYFDNYKSDAEWVIQFGSGQIATIYNYKDGRNYMGDEGLDKEDIRDWHIGGRGQGELKKMAELFPKHKVTS